MSKENNLNKASQLSEENTLNEENELSEANNLNEEGGLSKENNLDKESELNEENNLNKENLKNNYSKKNLIESHKIELYIGLVLSAIALVLVLLVGIISGISFLSILWKMLVSGIIFFILGLGIGFLLNTFVPEVIKLFSYSDNDINIETDKMPPEDTKNIIDYTLGDEKEDKEVLNTLIPEDENTSNENEQIIKKLKGHSIETNDPKILADAIRTKMKEDN